MKINTNRISVSVFAVGIGIWALTASSSLPALTLCAILIHEMGHVCFARLCDISCKGFSLTPFEARIRLTGAISYEKEILICLGGPLFNLASAAVVQWIVGNTVFSPPFSAFSSISAALALLNLLPIESLDGGRVIYCLLSRIGLHEIAAATVKILSFLALFCLWSASVYTLLRCGGNLSLFLFSATLFYRIFATTKTQQITSIRKDSEE